MSSRELLASRNKLRQLSIVRLVTLVVFHLHTLKQNILSGHQDSPVQHQFSRTRHPLYLLLHTNQHLRASHVILFCSLPSHSLSILSPPPPPAAPPLTVGGQRSLRGQQWWSSRSTTHRLPTLLVSYSLPTPIDAPCLLPPHTDRHAVPPPFPTAELRLAPHGIFTHVEGSRR
jgi:hypothetical protein